MIMSDLNFEQSCEEMIVLLSTFPIAIDTFFKKPYALIIPKSHPQIMGIGNNSLVFALSNNMVGKGFKYTSSDNYEDVPEDVFHLVGSSSGLGSDRYGLDHTLYWLRSMDLPVKIPPMKQFFFKHPQKRFYFTIMPNLCEDNNYTVLEWNEERRSKCTNILKLENLFGSTCQTIRDKIDEFELFIEPAGHGSEEDITPTIEHLFLVQKNNEGMGNLVIADLNHLRIHRKDFQYGVRYDYLDNL